MLHHVIHPQRAIAEFARVLCDGGVLVTVDPRSVRPIEIVKKAVRRRNPSYAPTHRAFRVDEYRSLLRGNGAFLVETVRSSGSFGLLIMAGLDAVGLSASLPRTRAWVSALERLDRCMAALPGMSGGGLNLSALARARS